MDCRARLTGMWCLLALALGPGCTNGGKEAEAGGEPETPPVSGAEKPMIRSRTGNVAGFELRWLEAGPADGGAVLLLHGGRFLATTWQDLGTLEVLAKAGFHVVALDLPGFGESPRGSGLFDLAPFVEEVLEGRAFVLSPSMSGRFSLPLLSGHPDLVTGFIAVAPVGIPAAQEGLEGLDVPALLLWGSEDQIVPLSHAEMLEAWMPQTRKVVFPGAAHPCYLDAPEEFHQVLVEFLQTHGDG